MKFIFNKIKEERKRKKVTIKELSKISGVSIGLISSIERGIINPSIEVVMKICKALEIHPIEIIDHRDIKSRFIVTKRKDQYCIQDGKNISFLATPIGLQKIRDAVLITYLSPKGEFGRKHISYDTDELIAVVKGKIKLYYGEEEHILRAGDSAFFSADKIHYIKNLSKGNSILVWCVFNKD
jgi:transcriptional regulator with XRE-family HTH domain